MNRKQMLVVLGSAVLCGFAFAQGQKPPSVAERLDALEQQVADLKKELATVKLADAESLATAKKQAAEARALANALATWAGAQAQGAEALARVLDDSEAKGFTFGINPDSRVVLLAGWREFATGLRTDVPKALSGDEPKDAVPADAPAKRP